LYHVKLQNIIIIIIIIPPAQVMASWVWI
jgi:hypothetical protein